MKRHGSTGPASLSSLFTVPTHILPPATTLALKFFELVLPAIAHSDEHASTYLASPSASSLAPSHGKLELLDSDQDASDDDDDTPRTGATQSASMDVDLPQNPRTKAQLTLTVDDCDFLSDTFKSCLTVTETGTLPPKTPGKGRKAPSQSSSQQSVESASTQPSQETAVNTPRPKVARTKSK